ncbi:hypothetical protein GGX14DRAFT_388625 [Mycena pura]|uniref:Uncharacterized protein n=1 Tax=Mycena pura TaxID=153505 RepID=A0AAD6YKN3_9AGAR|nr:hypothetical protein GGX14DRAFT_388625 [Mycena pura]
MTEIGSGDAERGLDTGHQKFVFGLQSQVPLNSGLKVRAKTAKLTASILRLLFSSVPISARPSYHGNVYPSQCSNTRLVSSHYSVHNDERAKQCFIIIVIDMRLLRAGPGCHVPRRVNTGPMWASTQYFACSSLCTLLRLDTSPPYKVGVSQNPWAVARRGNAERQGKPYIGSRECPGLLRVFSGYPDAEGRGSILVIASKQYDGINSI